VLLTLSGDDNKINDVVEFLRSGKKINSWGANVEKLIELGKEKTAEDDDSKQPCLNVNQHQVHTGNVDKFNWNPSVNMYL
jgi:hypothetical protein